jgi:YegS/Rv2252/BmrU family lipid kinase
MSGPQRVHAIYNPASANGRTAQRWTEIEPKLRKAFDTLEVTPTEAPGHARLLCRDALERGADLVISCGGDGTNNEVLCGFVDERGNNAFPGAELGLLASGTGSDFLRHLEVKDLDLQIEQLVSEPAVKVDYGVAEFVSHEGNAVIRPFLNEASVGVSGLIVDHIGRRSSRLGPTLTYLLGSIRGIMDHRDKPVTLVLDDGKAHKLPLTLAVMANGQYFGGGMWIAPEARCDDGWLDVLFTGGDPKLKFLGLLARVFKGNHIHQDTVTTARSKTVRLVPTEDNDVVLIDLDGEQPGRLPARFRIVEEGIRLRAAGLTDRPAPRDSDLFVPVEPEGQTPETPVVH